MPLVVGSIKQAKKGKTIQSSLLASFALIAVAPTRTIAAAITSGSFYTQCSRDPARHLTTHPGEVVI
jgi:hypothetical protein